MDVFSKDKRSEVMRKIKGENTLPELALRHHFWSNGYRGYRIHSKHLPGKPDIAFSRYKVAIFVDGCFWHGCSICYRPPKSNEKYWDAKIIRNMNRDKKCRNELKKLGWTVISVWEHALVKNKMNVTFNRIIRILKRAN